jgi:type I restriction enzyme S subunit
MGTSLSVWMVNSVRWSGGDAALNQRVMKFRSKSAELDSEFMFFRIQSDLKLLEETISATTVKHLAAKHIRELWWIVPPITEQRLIVDILWSFESVIAETQAEIVQARRVASALFECSFISNQEWETYNLGEVCRRITDGSHQSVQTTDRGYPFLFVSCIRSGRVQWEKCGYISEETYVQISKGREVSAGTVLYTAVGSYGHAVHIESDIALGFQRHIAFISPEASRILPAYVAMFLNSDAGRRWADSVAVGNAQKTVTLKSLAQLPIPVPPIDEQDKLLKPISSCLQFANEQQQMLEKLMCVKLAISSDLLSGRRGLKLTDSIFST